MTLITLNAGTNADFGQSEFIAFTESQTMYDGHRLRFFSFRLWIYPAGGYPTCLKFWTDFRTHCFQFPSNSFCDFFCVQKYLKVWNGLILSHLVYDTEFLSVTIYKYNKCMILSVLKSGHAVYFKFKMFMWHYKKKNYHFSLSEIQSFKVHVNTLNEAN